MHVVILDIYTKCGSCFALQCGGCNCVSARAVGADVLQMDWHGL